MIRKLFRLPLRLLYGVAWILEQAAIRLRRLGCGRTRAARRLLNALYWPSDAARVLITTRHELGARPRLFRPVTFNDHLQHAKLFGLQPVHEIFADKLAVRDWVRERIGGEYLPRLLWSGVSLAEARSTLGAAPFILKPTYKSGLVLIGADPGAFDWADARRKLDDAARNDHAFYYSERQYRWLPRRLLAEELLRDAGGQLPLDYKFFCFHGRVQMVQVDVGRFTRHTRALFDRDFNRLPVALCYPREDGPVETPAHFLEMRALAERLSEGQPFVRADFFDIGRPIFGELTLHPGAGVERFDPPEWDVLLGRLWTPGTELRQLHPAHTP